MPICDGCGTRADDLHIRRRAERLELASHFRPARVRVLFLDAAPPTRSEDFFYCAAADRSSRSLASRMFFDQIALAAGAPPSAEIVESLALAEFNRAGYFLLHAIECPLEEIDRPQDAIRRFAPSVIKRVQTDYDPSYLVPVAQPTQDLIRLFGLIGWGDRLVLNNGGPFADPYLGDPQRQASFGTAFGARIQKFLAALP
ncbi:MAG: hypothetical protein WAL86_07280 [Candidatus Acidiferrales bacterium]